MPFFRYQAKKGADGTIEKGEIEAESPAAARERLRAEGFLLLELHQATTTTRGATGGLFKRKKVGLKDKIIFTRQLSVMIRAGLSLVKALQALQKQSENAYFKDVIGTMINQVKGGQTLSKAMSRTPKIFPEVYVAVVKAGEQTGQLAEVLLNLAEQQEKEADLIGKVKGAMIYPGVILVTMVGVGFLIVFFVLPSLTNIFAESGQKLPFLTRMLLGTSDFIRHYLLILIPIVIGFFYLMRRWFKTKSGQSFYDHAKVSMPVFGGLTKKLYMARFSRTLAMLTKASLPIIQSIQIVEKTINNVHYKGAFLRIEQAVESGKSLSIALDKEPLFPPMVSQLTSLGEESGNLESVLLEIAQFYDKEVDAISRNLSTLLEPLLLIIMGIGVGFVVAAVLGPIYGLVQNFGG
jgi:type IV pilus assembly protein PilC